MKKILMAACRDLWWRAM